MPAPCDSPNVVTLNIVPNVLDMILSSYDNRTSNYSGCLGCQAPPECYAQASRLLVFLRIDPDRYSEPSCSSLTHDALADAPWPA